MNSYSLDSSSNIVYSDNGRILTFNSLSLTDAQYYSCSFNSSVKSEFFLIVLSKYSKNLYQLKKKYLEQIF